MSALGAAARYPFYRTAFVSTFVVLVLTASAAASQYSGEHSQQSEDTEDEAQERKVEALPTDVENEQQARILFEQGRTAFNGGDYASAALAFDQAYATRPHHSSIWNAALAWERAADPVKAANRFARYLDEAPPDALDRDTATARLQALGGKLGRLELRAEGVTELRVDGQAVDSTTVYVSPGSHVVTARKGSQSIRHLASVQAGELLSVALAPGLETVDAEKAADVRASGDEPEPPLMPINGRSTVVQENDTSWRGLPPITFYAGTVITATLAGVTVWSGIDTLAARDDYDREQSRAKAEEGLEKQDRTNILFAVTLGVALLTGVTALWLVDWDGEGSDRESASTLIRARW
jgi:tetratricopeptide (TPR) repeat protein